MIDPQGQANIWVKAKVGTDLLVLDFQTEHYMRKLETAITAGQVVLMQVRCLGSLFTLQEVLVAHNFDLIFSQDVGEELDTALDPLLRVTRLDADIKSIRTADKEVKYNPNFRFYVTTKLQNPHYLPEIAIKTTIVNFAVKEKGLQVSFSLVIACVTPQ